MAKGNLNLKIQILAGKEMTKIFLRAFLKISHPQYVYTPLLWPLVLLYYNVMFYKNIFGEQNLHKSIFPGDALLFGFLNPFPPPQFWNGLLTLFLTPKYYYYITRS